MKKLIIYIVVILLLTTYSKADNITIDDQPINLVAGETVTTNITISTNKLTTINLGATVLPDGDGFNITFSKNNFELSGTETITVTIKTSINLIPDTYTINLWYDAEDVQESTTKKQSGGTITISTEPDDVEDEENTDSDEEPDNQESEDENKDDEPASEQQDEQEDEITNKDKSEKKQETNPLHVLIISLIISISGYIIYVMYKKRKEKK